MYLINKPINIKNVNISNRIVMPPMATAKSDLFGNVTKSLCDYYSVRVQNNAIGLIITEHSYINPDGKASINQLSLASDTNIAGCKKLVDTIHRYNTKVFAQINHAGSLTSSEITGKSLLSASAVKHPRKQNAADTPTEMSVCDIQRIVSDFALAAKRAKAAGFDGVEIHSAHGYLLNQFFSPLTNKRTDEYNGFTISGRVKIHLEVIKSIRETVGPDYPIALRLGACDYTNGGTVINDSISAAIIFEEAGIDLLDISGGLLGYINPNSKEQGYFSEISSAIKSKVTIPVILTGGITNINVAEQLLKNNSADLIGIGRALLKDPQWAVKSINSLK